MPMATEIRFTKWGGGRHWHYTLEELGEDEHGRWYGGRRGIRIQRGHEAPREQPHDFVALVPHDGDWIANFNDPGAGTRLDVYVDVTTRPLVADHAVEAVDLDLDVVRKWDGTVVVLDEDEFAEHQVRYAYPLEVVERALATTAELVDRITAGAEPFGAIGSDRVAQFTAQTSG
jgi:hypothetical protein